MNIREHFGSVVQFGTAGIRALVGPGTAFINERTVCAAAAATESHFRDQYGRDARFLVGYDGRATSATLAQVAADTIVSTGSSADLVDEALPTPVVAFAVRRFDYDGGIVITASHNGPTFNGFKVYSSEGAQLSPDDEVIVNQRLADLIARRHRSFVRDAAAVVASEDLISHYVAACAKDVGPAGSAVHLVYTPLHGVGGPTFLRLMSVAGVPAFPVVGSQFESDPAFPTVSRPNPEEPEALEQLLALGTDTEAEVAFANDGDGDRLAVAVRELGEWHVLTGNELGVLLLDYLLSTASSRRNLVCASLVSTQMIDTIASTYAAKVVRTPTGFKNIIRPALLDPDSLCFAFEEALGYAVSSLVLDKDGMTAALAFIRLVELLRSRGQSVLDHWDELEARFGVHRSRTIAVWEQLGERGSMAQALLSWCRGLADGDPGAGLTAHHPLDPRLTVVTMPDGSRVCVRPSGTEPKTKIYLESVVSAEDRTLGEARAAADRRLDEIVSTLPDSILR